MSGRLSEDVIVATWDTGFSLPLAAKLSKIDYRAAASLKLNELLRAENPAAAVQAVDRHDLYVTLVEAGPEDALEILPLLSKEQFTAIIDYEGWQDDRLAVHKIIGWLDLYKHFGVDQLFQRFRDLDEEYQIALLNPYVELVDEETYEKMPQELQDQFQMLPCNTLWYRLKNADSKVEEFVGTLIQGGLGEDVAYTYSLLSHAAYLPPNEQEALIARFRNARLEEDGFVLLEEARDLFAPFDGGRLYQQWSCLRPDFCGAANLVWQSDNLFLDAVLCHMEASGQYDQEVKEQVKRSIAVLANGIASVCRVEVDDVKRLRQVLEHARSLLSLGLEVLSGARVDFASTIFVEEHAKTIFKFALSLVDNLRESTLDMLCKKGDRELEGIKSAYAQRRFGKLLRKIDTEMIDCLDIESLETLKGLFNRLPLMPNEVVGSGNVQRILFKPISCLQDLTVLKMKLEALRPIGRRTLEPVTESSSESVLMTMASGSRFGEMARN